MLTIVIFSMMVSFIDNINYQPRQMKMSNNKNKDNFFDFRWNQSKSFEYMNMTKIKELLEKCVSVNTRKLIIDLEEQSVISIKTLTNETVLQKNTADNYC